MQGAVWVSGGGGCVSAGEGRSPGPAAHTIRRYPDTKYKAVSLKVRHPAPSDGQSSLLSSAYNKALVLPLSLLFCLLSCSVGLTVVSVCLVVCLSPSLLSSAHNEALSPLLHLPPPPPHPPPASLPAPNSSQSLTQDACDSNGFSSSVIGA